MLLKDEDNSMLISLANLSQVSFINEWKEQQEPILNSNKNQISQTKRI